MYQLHKSHIQALEKLLQLFVKDQYKKTTWKTAHIPELVYLYIGYKNTPGARVQEMNACRDCVQYFDERNHLTEFEPHVSQELGHPWIWKETHMTPEELASWIPETNKRIVFVD